MIPDVFILRQNRTMKIPNHKYSGAVLSQNEEALECSSFTYLRLAGFADESRLTLAKVVSHQIVALAAVVTRFARAVVYVCSEQEKKKKQKLPWAYGVGCPKR
jgi:hypothetical protein